MRSYLLALVLVLAVLLPPPLLAAAAAPLRVMPLGDSITWGSYNGTPQPDQAGYRQPLGARMLSAGRPIDFVGSQAAGPAGFADREHEGHPGYTTAQVLAALPAWLAAAHPDVVLLLIGTNDIGQAAADPLPAAGPAVGRAAAIIDAIEASGAWVLVAPIPPLSYPGYDFAAAVDGYNAGLGSAVYTRALAGKHVRWVGVPWQPSLILDGAHPTPAGYQVLADAWYPALSPLVAQAAAEPVGCDPRPPVVLTRTEVTPSATRVTLAARSPIAGVVLGHGSNVVVSDVAYNGAEAAFTVARPGPGPWHLAFTVRDGCGPWRTFIGGGS